MATHTSAASLVSAESQVAPRERKSKLDHWPEAWIVVSFLCQVALLFSVLARGRMIFRAVPFFFCMALCFVGPRRAPSHPAIGPAIAVLTVIALSMLHPDSDWFFGGTAQAVMYFALLAPLFWVPRLNVDLSTLKRVFFLIWAFQTASASVGVLQVYFPGRFQPHLSSVVEDGGHSDGLKISLASGESVFRPMGLTDSPGGAAGAGFYCMLLGGGMLLWDKRPVMKFSSVASMSIGVLCLYLCQVRSLMVFAGVCLLVLLGILMLRKQVGRTTSLAAALAVMFVTGFFWAVSVGGDGVTRRFETLIDDPQTTYKNSRGYFLEHALFEALPSFPLGAGLGGWGMMKNYFGNAAAPSVLWTEIQLQGWIFDGGIPLVLTYSAAIFLALKVAWTLAIRAKNDELWLIAAVVFAYDLGAVALTFNYPFFNSQGAAEFWMFNALLFAAYWQRTQAVKHSTPLRSTRR